MLKIFNMYTVIEFSNASPAGFETLSTFNAPASRLIAGTSDTRFLGIFFTGKGKMATSAEDESGEYISEEESEEEPGEYNSDEEDSDAFTSIVTYTELSGDAPIDAISKGVKFDYMFAYNDIIMVPSKLVPDITALAALLDKKWLRPHIVVVAKVTTKGMLSELSLDNVDTVLGYALMNMDTDELLYISNASFKIQSNIMISIQKLLKDVFSYRLMIDEPNFNAVKTFLVDHGFLDPVYDSTTKSIILTCYPHMPKSATITAINKIVSAIKSDSNKIMFVVPGAVAQLMIKTLDYMTEAFGSISITRINSAGEAILGLSYSDITSGSADRVVAEFKTNISFHTHPDVLTTEHGVYVSWPSANDVKVFTRHFVNSDYPQLMHVVVSPEGMWVMKLTIQFQALLRILIKFGLETCIDQILDGVNEKLAPYDVIRSTVSVPAHDRNIQRKEYLSTVNGITLRAVAPPDVCNVARKYYKSTLYQIELIKWQRFTEQEPVQIFCEYIPDPTHNLPIIA